MLTFQTPIWIFYMTEYLYKSDNSCKKIDCRKNLQIKTLIAISNASNDFVLRD